jgi:oxygen-independent coproporphyrinogen-3 oxidase
MNAWDHIYLHVPFCDGKCAYCSFYSIPYSPRRAAAYLDALTREMDKRIPSPAPAPETIYIGGGTPTVLSAPELRRLGAIVRARFAADRLREWTVEANPGTLDPGRIAALQEAGVNRVSLGAQSFDDTILQSIGRRHTAADIGRAARALRDSGFGRVGIDLIAGLPGVDATGWQRTLRQAVDIRPEHLAIYALSLEPGSRLGRRVARGAVTVPDDDAQVEALGFAEVILDEAGYRRYEISNYAWAPSSGPADATPPTACLHNVSFWRGEDYVGLGPAAASRDGSVRRVIAADVDAYVDAARQDSLPPAENETLSVEDDAAERFVFAFRLLREAVDPARFAAAQPALAARWEARLRELARDGLVRPEPTGWRLAPPGIDLADYVARELLAAGEAP